jgi:hypothetical protein
MEIWREVEDYEGLYEVSNMGNVRRVGGSVLKPVIRTNGYLQVSLSKNNIRTSPKIHRLVARAFPEICGEWFEGCDINHKDECRTNNIATNLEICDRRYNNNYGHRKEKDADSKACPILQYTLDGVFVKEWKSMMEIQRSLGIWSSSVSRCCRGIFRSSHGYIFKFKDEVSDTPIPSPTPFTSRPTLTNNKKDNHARA